jgi:hypothetical protein
VTALLAKAKIVETERMVKGMQLRMEDLKVLIQARGVKPVYRNKHDLSEQWIQEAVGRDEIEIPAWTDEDDSELQKWLTLEIGDVAYAAGHAMESARDESSEAKFRYKIARTFDDSAKKANRGDPP